MQRVLVRVIIVIFLCLSIQLRAQEEIPPQERLFVKVEGLSGSTWAHHAAIDYLIEAPPFGGSVYVGLRSSGKRSWEHDLKLPRYGFGYQVSQLGGKALGNSHSMFIFIGSSFVDYRKFHWNYTLGFGFGYVDNAYDPEKNPLNIVNGSPINAFLKASTGLQYCIADAHGLGLDAGLFHLSNGNSSLPNWGINVLYWSLNYTYLFGNPASKKTVEPHDSFAKNTRITMYGGGGFKEEPPVDGVKFGVADFHVNFWRAFRPAHSFGGGITTFYDASSAKILWRRNHDYLLPSENYTGKGLDNWSVGAQVGYMLNMHPFYFSFEFGVYLLSSINKDIFNRWYLEYQLAKNIRAFAGLKSRFGKADFITVGVGYDIFVKRK